MSKVNYQLLFYSLWALLLALQGTLTGLTSDEAYYWKYAQHLAWGYFDHPPAIALFIHPGYLLFNHEIGVRLVSVIAGVLTIYLLERLIKPTNQLLFYALVSSVCILHFVGFLALPDGPLLLTATLYFHLLKNELASPTRKGALAAGLVIALMLMSKYIGFLILLFTLPVAISHFSRRYILTVFLVSAILLLPHLYWHINAGFPSLQYHFFERSSKAYQLSFTTGYLLSQPFILGPLTGFIFFVACFRPKISNAFERALLLCFWGGYAWFFLMSFKGRVEGHWTLFTIIPALWFGYRFLEHGNRKKWFFKYVFPASILLTMLLRVFVILPLKTGNKGIDELNARYTGNGKFMNAIHAETKDFPVAFMNSYQLASLYSFYTGKEAFSLNNITGRRNQFDIWDLEEKYRGKTIALLPNFEVPGCDTVPGMGKATRYCLIENFQAYSAIRIQVTKISPIVAMDDSLDIWLKFEPNGRSPLPDLEANPDYPVYLSCHLYKLGNKVSEISLARIDNEAAAQELKFTIPAPAEAGEYKIFLSLAAGWLTPSRNSRGYKVRVAE